ncbi:MAG: TetR/AcrR family transcriptional regulator [Firmicutes bacterium]|nr:TetR/AcrR family transcriptional regulator [Bacillota bacterium]
MSKDKKTLIYEAALSLVYENYDMSRIKVADIAERASIGKGTVYEYFDSKEQVIGEALIYMFEKGVEEFQFDENVGFKETYLGFLRNISSMINRNMFEFMTLNKQDLDSHATIKAIIVELIEQVRQRYIEIFEQLVDKSVQERIVKEKPSRFDWEIAVLSSMNCIFLYKQYGGKFYQLNNEEVLEKGYNTYVKLLN